MLKKEVILAIGENQDKSYYSTYMSLKKLFKVNYYIVARFKTEVRGCEMWVQILNTIKRIQTCIIF